MITNEVFINSHRARKNAKAAEDVEYPAYGVTGPGKDTSPTSGDRKLAQNAQLYHYQHQKNQMIAFDGQADSQRRSMSDNESEDGEEGDYTVYECPGLAPVILPTIINIEINRSAGCCCGRFLTKFRLEKFKNT